jgi:glycosyltransferase involved in cell wall biosynthesis
VSELATSRMVDLFITLNDADARAMVKYKLASSDRVVSLRYEYGVDLSRFDPDKIDMTHLGKLRKEHRLNDDVPVIGYVGRMIGAKGILELFEAFCQIRAKGTRAKLVYLGNILSSDKDSSSVDLLKALVKKSGFDDDVVFFGLQRDVPLYLSLMDVVVLPSHYEGFPRIPVEAGAMRKPSVCTAVAGVEVAVDEGETGFIVPIKDPKRLAEAIEKIITNPDLSRTMGINARARVVELFDQNKIVDQQVRIYQEFFKKKESGATYTI